MKIGICGYGNLGKAVEKRILSNKSDKLVGIFSRRNNVASVFGTPVYSFDKASLFEDEIEAMIMCGGSQEDLLWQSPEMLKYFDIIDTFDTHARIEEHKTNLLRVSEEFGHKAIYSCGWDPGLFSIARTLAGNLFSHDAVTFWGMGVSQGHSEALRNIPGVLDGVEFTVPNRSALNSVESDPTYAPKPNKMHQRLCYIALDGSRSEFAVSKDIRKTPNYFKDQDVTIIVKSPYEIEELKSKMYHKGVVLDGDKDCSMRFSVDMDSNPDFTAKIIVAYAHALPKLESGAYSVLDVPISMIGNHENERYL